MHFLTLLTTITLALITTTSAKAPDQSHMCGRATRWNRKLDEPELSNDKMCHEVPIVLRTATIKTGCTCLFFKYVISVIGKVCF